MGSFESGYDYDEYNLRYINRRLIEAGRDDLVILNRAQMADVEDPESLVNRRHNFAAKFRMPGLTEEQILDLSRVPRLQKVDDLAELWDLGQYPGPSLFNFGGYAAFTRMVILYPHFAVDLINKINDVSLLDDFRTCQQELMKAYNLMSHLVDEADFGVRQKDGSVNEKYLLD
jgi:hypothetical protein